MPTPFSLRYHSNTVEPWITPSLASRSAARAVEVPAGTATITVRPGFPEGLMSLLTWM